jgi:hypothetical protein
LTRLSHVNASISCTLVCELSRGSASSAANSITLLSFLLSASPCPDVA